MKNKTGDASWIEAVGYGSRHGPYPRGEPLIRGKPPFIVTPVISVKERSLLYEGTVNIVRFPIKSGMTARGKPVGCLHRESRVRAAKNSVGFFGVFIPNRECFGLKERQKLEGRRQKF